MKKATSTDATLSRQMTILFAIVCGLAVANLYYAQPLLPAIARTFHIASGRASLVVVLGQVGYVIGITLLVPLGDIANRRRLTLALLSATCLGLGIAAITPSFGLLLAATLLFSLTTVVALILLPLAATLAKPEERGRVIGTIMSGVLIGVLLARTASGIIAQASSWRVVYVFAAIAMLTLLVILSRVLPQAAPSQRLAYPTLLRSISALVREEPLLRQRATYGFLSFAGFSALWTSLAFLLVKPPYGYNEATIGLFGLAGLAGTLMAYRAGKLIDYGKERLGTVGFLIAILISWGFLVTGGGNLITLLFGIVLLDLGVQGVHVMNQGVIYRLRPEARSRLTTVYMTAYFLGGVIGSAASAWVYARWGWSGVCVVGTVLAVMAAGLWVKDMLGKSSADAN